MVKRITVNLTGDEWEFIRFLAKRDNVTPQRELQMIFETELWELTQLDYYQEYLNTKTE